MKDNEFLFTVDSRASKSFRVSFVGRDLLVFVPVSVLGLGGGGGEGLPFPRGSPGRTNKSR